jgi:hypothetical protein
MQRQLNFLPDSKAAIGLRPGCAEADSLTAFSGAGTVNRTPDLRITNALLYQLSYTGQNLWRQCIQGRF